MRIIIIILAVIVGLAMIAGVAILWLLQDPNQYKADIQQLINDNAGIQVELNGDLNWRLWPPIVLQAEDLGFEDDETKYQVERLNLHASVGSLLSSTPELRIQSLSLEGLTMSDKRFESVTQVNELTLSDFAIGEPSELHLEAVLSPSDPEPISVNLDASITYFDEEDRVVIKDARFLAADLPGMCDAEVTQLSREPSSNHEETADDLLPLDLFRSKDWDADCTITAVDAGGVTLENIAIKATNTNGLSDIAVNVPDFFDGTADVNVDINASRHDPRWKVTPNLEGANTQAVMAWMEQNLNWAAPLLFNGEFAMVGNTTNALIGSMNGKARFDGGQGKIDISAIKRNAESLSKLASAAGANVLPELQDAVAKVAAWPDVLDYSKLQGDWSVNGNQQTLDFALDNLGITANGLVDAVSEKIDMKAELTFNDDPDLHSFDISPALTGIPIPLRCTGTMAEPECGLDQGAAQKIVASMLRGGAGDKLEKILDDKLGDKVPDGAKDLLKGLFGKKKK